MFPGLGRQAVVLLLLTAFLPACGTQPQQESSPSPTAPPASPTAAVQQPPSSPGVGQTPPTMAPMAPVSNESGNFHGELTSIDRAKKQIVVTLPGTDTVPAIGRTFVYKEEKLVVGFEKGNRVAVVVENGVVTALTPAPEGGAPGAPPPGAPGPGGPPPGSGPSPDLSPVSPPPGTPPSPGA